MLKKLLSIGTAITTSMLIASCSSENPAQLSVSEVENPATARLNDYLDNHQNLWAIPSACNYVPSIIMSTDPVFPGNMEMLRKTQDNQIQHFWWNETYMDLNPGIIFGSNVLCDPALCSNLKDNWLQAVVREGSNTNKLVHYWRDANTLAWQREFVFGDKCTGSPAMICNTNTKYFEVLSKTTENKIVHWQRRGDRNTDWGTAPRYTITPPANHVILQDPVITQDASGNLFLAFIARYNSSSIRLLVYKKSLNGSWTKLNHTSIAGINPLAKPAISAFGTQGWISILVTKENTCLVYEYRLKYSSTLLTGGEQICFHPHSSVKYISQVKKDASFMYIFNGAAGGDDIFPHIEKLGYTDGQ